MPGYPVGPSPDTSGGGSLSDILSQLGINGPGSDDFISRVLSTVGMGPTPTPGSNGISRAPVVGPQAAQPMPFAGSAPQGGVPAGLSMDATMGGARPPQSAIMPPMQTGPASLTPGAPSGPPSLASVPPPMLRPGTDLTPNPSGSMAPVDSGPALAAQPDTGGDSSSMIAQILDSLNRGAVNPEDMKWLALAKAGFTMAASQNPHVFGAMGEGASAGLSDYLAMKQQGLADKIEAAKLGLTQQDYENQQAYRKAQTLQAQADLQEKQSEFAQTLPLEKTKADAYANLASAHGSYFDARASAPAGAGSYKAQAYNQIYQGMIDQGFSPQDAAVGAMSAVGGQLSERDRLASQYLKTLGGATATDPSAAYAWADQQLAARGGTGAPAGAGTPSPRAGGAPGLPAGALGMAPAGGVDGQTVNGGQGIIRGGFVYQNTGAAGQ